MLSSAELALVDRDPDIGALSLLLDHERLAEWLSDRTETPYVVRPRRLRYKKSTSCVLAFDLVAPGDGGGPAIPCLAKTYAAAASTKAEKSLLSVPSSQRIAHDPALRLVVTTAAGDRHLPALGMILGDEDPSPLLRRVVPPDLDGDFVVETVRYNPERRWVGRLKTADGGHVALRAYRPSEVESHRRAYATFRRSSVRTPAPLGISRRHGVIAVEWLEGSTLTGNAGRGSFVAAGAALAGLHGHKAHRLPTRLGYDPVGRVLDAADHIAVLVPELEQEAMELAQRVSRAIAHGHGQQCRIHGDFSTDQVIVDDRGGVSVVDLDAATVGDPATDLAGARAAWMVDNNARLTDDDPDHAMEALYGGYETIAPLPLDRHLACHEAGHLLRRAVEPFRSGAPDWARQLRHIVSLAQRALDGRSTAGPSRR